MIPAALIILATLDGLFAGFRDAAGRNPLLSKRRYYTRAMIKGALAGLGASALIAAPVLTMLMLSDQPQTLYQELLQAGQAMATVYGAYGSLALGALCVYAIPRAEISSLATVLILGPFTFLRVPVIALGAAAGLWACPSLPGALFVTTAAVVMASLGPLFNRINLSPRNLDAQLKAEGL